MTSTEQIILHAITLPPIPLTITLPPPSPQIIPHTIILPPPPPPPLILYTLTITTTNSPHHYTTTITTLTATTTTNYIQTLVCTYLIISRYFLLHLQLFQISYLYIFNYGRIFVSTSQFYSEVYFNSLVYATVVFSLYCGLYIISYSTAPLHII